MCVVLERMLLEGKRVNKVKEIIQISVGLR